MLNKKLIVGLAVVAGVSASQYKIHEHSAHKDFVSLYSQHETNNHTTNLKAINSIGTTTIKSPIGLWQLTAPAMTGSKITVIPNNTKVTVLGESNGWYKVIYNGITGWSYAEYTTGLHHSNISTEPTTKTNQANLKAKVTSPVGLWLIKSPSMQGNKIEIMPNDSELTVLGHNGNWTKVNYNGQTGYCYTAYTEAINSPIKTPVKEINHTKMVNHKKEVKHIKETKVTKTSAQTKLHGEVGSQYGLWLLEAPSMEGHKIQLMPDGGQFTILGYSGNWTKVDYNGNIGYCYTEYTSNISSTKLGSKIIGQTTITSPVGLWQLEAPSFAGEQLEIIPYQTKLNVYGEHNGWYQVEYKGVIGWSYSKYTSRLNSSNKVATKTTNSVTKIVTHKDVDYKNAKNGTYGTVNSSIGLWMLNSPSMQGNKIKVIPANANLKILGHSGDWTKVDYNGNIGYSYSKYITQNASSNTTNSLKNVRVQPMVGLWMLQAPNLKGGHITVIPYRTELSVRAVRNGWYEVSFGNNIGWVDGTYTNAL